MKDPTQHDIYGKQHPDEVWYKLTEIKAILKCSLSHLYALIESGELRCVKIGLRGSAGIRVSRSMLDEFLRKREKCGSEAPKDPAPKPESAGGFTMLDADRLREAWKDH